MSSILNYFFAFTFFMFFSCGLDVDTSINQVNSDELLDFISGKKLIIHNAPFDIGFLNHELKKINKKIINIDKNVIDSLELARSKYPGTSNSLDNLCKRFNIDTSRRKKHNALLHIKTNVF